MLRKHLGVASPAYQGRKPEGYNGIKLYHFMCKYYQWSKRDCDELDYAAFFGLFREAQLQIERENEEMERAKNNNGDVVESDGSDLEQYMARPRVYNG